jgi:hypothetical protein
LLHHNLSRKCRKIVKFVSITHSERNILKGPIVATAISRETVNQCWKEMAFSPTERSWCVLEFARCNSFVISSCAISSRTMFTSHYFQRHYQNCESASTPQSGTSHKTNLRGFGRNWSIAWTSAVSHVGRTPNAFKVTMKLQTFLFQMVVTSCISVQYL